MKLIIDIPEILLDRIKSAKCVPDMYGSDIVNTVVCVRDGTPYEQRPHGTWIPCSERLPEEGNSTYLVTIDSGDGFSRVTSRFFFDEEIGWNDANEFITAWMPLPEPYKGEGKEK